MGVFLALLAATRLETAGGERGPAVTTENKTITAFFQQRKYPLAKSSGTGISIDISSKHILRRVF